MINEPDRTDDQRLRAAVESAPSGLLMVDSSGRIVLVNAEVERLFGYRREELLGNPVDILVPERLRGAHPEYRAGFFRDPKVRSMGAGRELFGRRKDGTEFPVEIGLTPVVTKEGLFVISSIVDISARRRAEDRFRAAVESSPNGMVMIDRQGTIVLVNREVERLFAYPREALLGRSIEMLVPERFRQNHPEFRGAFFQEPSTRPMGAGRELYGLRSDGQEIPVEIGLNPIETEEGVFVLSSIVDISARKEAETEHLRLEEQLRQSQKLEAMGTLAGGVAHDFNNILGSIIGFGELAREAAQGAALPEVVSDVDEVLRAAMRGRELVQRILRFSRREGPQLRPTDLSQLVAESARLLRATLPASIELRVGGTPSVPPVAADPTSVQQVIMNLATNSAHAMPGGGRIEVALQPFYVRDSMARAHPTLREGPHVLLIVTDTGVGMEQSVAARAFEPFFTTKPPGTGSGLGLAMVHGIMHDHEGDVQLRSAPGEGTTVTCFFPAAELAAGEVEPTTPDLPRGTGQRILFVDDELGLAEVGRRRLTSLGYQVVLAADGPAALELLRAAPASFELVITDYSMPRMSGLDLAQAIVALRPDLPVILLTGFLEDLPGATLRAAGVRRLAKKPVTGADLASMVHEVLQGKTTGTKNAP